MTSASAKLGRLLARVPHQLAVALAVGILSGTLVVSAFISTKELAVSIAVAGTFVGTAVLILSLRSLGQMRVTDQGHSPGQLRRELKVSQAETASARAVAIGAAREIARLEQMRVNLASLTPIQKLALLEVETKLTDFQHRVIGGKVSRLWLRNGCRRAFVGVVQIPVKAHLGVDLQNVQVCEDPEGSLVVSGLKMMSIVDTVGGATWLLDEVRTESVAGDQVLRAKSHVNDSSAKTYSREQELQLRARLSQGQDFKVFESGLIRMAEQFLRVLLAPLGKEIIFEAQPRSGGRPLLAYLTESNCQLDERLRELRRETGQPPQLDG